jgi:hypothetical protein
VGGARVRSGGLGGGRGRAIADALIAESARVLVSDVDLYLSLEFRNIKNSW